MVQDVARGSHLIGERRLSFAEHVLHVALPGAVSRTVEMRYGSGAAQGPNVVAPAAGVVHQQSVLMPYFGIDRSK